MNFWTRYRRIARWLLLALLLVCLVALFSAGHVPAGSRDTTGL
ncbi:hypothetical protein [Ramlibacter rhizophilus]|nr:hypothetical protein [Ramlibacter rhizophilus]